MDEATPYFTRTGDKGETSLIGGIRVEKYDSRVECYGNVDELNCFLGLAYFKCKDENLRKILLKIQKDLFILGSDLAAPLDISEKIKFQRINKKHIDEIEDLIKEYSKELKPLHRFIVPGGSELACYLHIARAVCRRAERSAVKASKQYKINELIIPYLNRLSSLFFVLARYANKIEKIEEIEV